MVVRLGNFPVSLVSSRSRVQLPSEAFNVFNVKRGDRKMINIYRIDTSTLSEVKKILEEPERVEEGKIVRNEFARNGYTLRDAKSMDFEKNCSYLYVKGEEEFFEKNEKRLTDIENVEKIEGKEYEEVKAKIEEEASEAEEGIGAIFG